ncbi:redoxin domain-containing protein [Halonotius terrestris]|uniref:Redoxin domain-containing protein n=1 Tax=Halonotius terrestris TaxID=2487750 RepID=A0A8J8P9I0_9EURY|nr:redoxin domain-containing protein [Halonotius terrestris]TQQ81105.1 redoxin domain-containing protein [Halonotius terrestris]
MLDTGETAPDMTLPMATPEAAAAKPRGEYRTADVERFELSETLADGPVTLVTIPGVYSQGCTEELCTIADRHTDLGELPGQVYALSADTPWSQLAFIDEYDISYPLLSGFNSDVLRQLGVRRPDGILQGIATRTAFVIGPDRDVAYTWEADDSLVPDFDAVTDAVAAAETD